MEMYIQLIDNVLLPYIHIQIAILFAYLIQKSYIWIENILSSILNGAQPCFISNASE